MPAVVGVEGLADGVGVRREGVRQVDPQAARPRVLHAHLVPVEEPRVVEVQRARVARDLPHAPLEGRHGVVAPPRRVGRVADAAAGQLAGELGVVLEVRADGARVAHDDELVVAVGVPGVGHHLPQVPHGLLDLGHQPVHAGLPPGRVLRLAGALQQQVALDAVGHDGAELQVVVGPRYEQHHLHARVAGLDGEVVALDEFVGVLLAPADADVRGGGARAGDVVRDVGGDAGAVDGGVGRAVAPVGRAVGAGLVRADALAGYLAVAEGEEGGLARLERSLGGVAVELDGLGGADLLQFRGQGGRGRGKGRCRSGSGGAADGQSAERGGERRERGEGTSQGGSACPGHGASPSSVVTRGI